MNGVYYVEGTGRPIAGSIIEDDGLNLSSVSQILASYRTNVDNVAGAWGVIIPNSVGTKGFSGIKRVESRNLSDGDLYAQATDSDGVWPSGANTVNPRGGDRTPIVLNENDATLPVELSSFTANINSQGGITVMWATQSETGVNGYYINRATVNNLSEALRISSLIPASNTSQQQVYVYNDNELYEPGTYYYWLEIQDIDGVVSYYGSRSVTFGGNGNNGTPEIPLVTGIRSIYPNPFNPSAVLACCNSTAVGTNPTCNGGTNGSATVTPTGTAPFTYSWNTIPVQTTQTATGLGAGTYTVTVTDNNGCQSTATVTLTNPPAMTAPITSTNVTCNGGNNGSATVNPTGSTGPYTYLWSNGQTTQTATGLIAGTYTVTVTSAVGCTVTNTVTITQPTPITVTTTTVSATCSLLNGSATANPSGGVGPYTYSWNTIPVQTTQTATGLGAGTYTVTVTGAGGCTATATATVSTTGSISATATGTNVS